MYLFDTKTREVSIEAAQVNDTSAAIQMMLAKAKRDLGDISDREMSTIENQIGGLSGGFKTLFNPFTGEIRRVQK